MIITFFISVDTYGAERGYAYILFVNNIYFCMKLKTFRKMASFYDFFSVTLLTKQIFFEGNEGHYSWWRFLRCIRRQKIR